jgi:hypothetical protein
METRIEASTLWLRALFAGSFAFLLGVAGHVMADGLLPGTAFMTVLYLGTILTSVPFLVQVGSRWRMVLLLVGGQTFIHLCLTLSAGHAGDPRPRPSAALPHEVGMGSLPVVDGHRVGSFQDAFVGTNAQPATTPTLPIHHLMADMSAHAPMMAAHLAAAAVVALWLAHGERVAFSVLAITASLVLALVRPVSLVAVPVSLRRTHVAEQVSSLLRERLLARPASRRGPPLLAA